MKEITYEVIAYETESDFFNRSGIIADTGIIHKSDALSMVKDLVPHYYAVKLQSNDREYIKIFKA
jgi:hypothetical protein